VLRCLHLLLLFSKWLSVFVGSERLRNATTLRESKHVNRLRHTLITASMMKRLPLLGVLVNVKGATGRVRFGAVWHFTRFTPPTVPIWNSNTVGVRIGKRGWVFVVNFRR
jgi:hypothetical protein